MKAGRPLVLSMLGLAACATPARMHTEAELNAAGEQCGLSTGELMQDDSEKRLLFMMRTGATQEQRACVFSWAHKNHLHLAVLEGVTFQDR